MNKYVPTSPEEWRHYWQAKGFPWRTEPEIDAKRQEELRTCRAIAPDIKKGMYPFKNRKLSRADVEWLLATHEGGPVDWSDERQRKRRGLDLRGADLCGANLSQLPLAGLYAGSPYDEWLASTEEQHQLAAVHMTGANLRSVHLEGAELSRAHLQRASLRRASLQGADLRKAHLEGANLSRALLDNINLAHATLSDAKRIGPSVADAQWKNVNLTLLPWSHVSILGEEYEARQQMRDGRRKDKAIRLKEYEEAVRANRQLAVLLQDQGLNEDAARFAYRAQVLQRKVLWKQRNFWKWLGSALLALLAGYGYRMWRILVAYLLVVLLCAVSYFILGMSYEPHVSFLEAVLTSVTAFHGRVFSEPFLHPGAPQLWVTAFEAVMGLVIEGVCIAMLTQKFFGK